MKWKTIAQVGNGFLIVMTIGIGSVFAGLAQAGSLQPPPSAAPGGTPAPTMHTLEQTPPAWDQVLPADDTSDPCNSSRFTCVMGGAAVRDNETGLVWEKTPDVGEGNWFSATGSCRNRLLGLRKGWRLPSVHELQSLSDGNSLPLGHPFVGTVPDFFWSRTTYNAETTSALAVTASDGNTFVPQKLTGSARRWCVRGGHNHADGGG